MLSNEEIARKLRAHATELARGGENLYRVRAFRRAAMAVMSLTDEVAELVTGRGPAALERVPGIGRSLADTIAEYARGEVPGEKTAALSSKASGRVHPGRASR
jgi:DNA polymerase/3'-5' exonuclease PolX